MRRSLAEICVLKGLNFPPDIKVQSWENPSFSTFTAYLSKRRAQGVRVVFFESLCRTDGNIIVTSVIFLKLSFVRIHCGVVWVKAIAMLYQSSREGMALRVHVENVCCYYNCCRSCHGSIAVVNVSVVFVVIICPQISRRKVERALALTHWLHTYTNEESRVCVFVCFWIPIQNWWEHHSDLC